MTPQEHESDGALDLEKKRSPSLWAIVGVVLFAVAFVIGWRSVTTPPKRAGSPGGGRRA